MGQSGDGGGWAARQKRRQLKAAGAVAAARKVRMGLRHEESSGLGQWHGREECELLVWLLRRWHVQMRHSLLWMLLQGSEGHHGSLRMRRGVLQELML